MRRTQRRRNSTVRSVIAGIFCVMLGVIWIIASIAAEAPVIFILVGIAIIIMSGIQVLKDLNIIK